MPQTPLRSSVGFVLLLATGCAHSWSLKPASEKPEERNGMKVETLITPKCVVQAGFQSSGKQELYVYARVTNKSPAPLGISPTQFSLEGTKEVLSVSPDRATDPEVYAKELTDKAEVMDSRTKLDTYQGIDEMSALKTGKEKDAQLDAVRADYEKKRKEADAAKIEAADLRARIAAAGQSPLKSATLAPGKSAEGRLIFKAAFVGEGPVNLVIDHPDCSGSLPFQLDR